MKDNDVLLAGGRTLLSSSFLFDSLLNVLFLMDYLGRKNNLFLS